MIYSILASKNNLRMKGIQFSTTKNLFKMPKSKSSVKWPKN